MNLRYAKHVAYLLAACTAISDAAYLWYLNSHHMVRSWSGINSILLGAVLGAWSLALWERTNRWLAWTLAAIGALNLLVGTLFFF